MDIFYPLKLFADLIVYKLLSLNPDSALGEALNFFLYDSLKILILLLGIIFLVSFLRSYLPPEKLRKKLDKLPRLLSHAAAAGLGILTPFCSCSAVPLFLGFVEAGLPLGITFSFLIASPLINEIALVMLLGLYGWKISLLYIASGFIIAVLAGLILDRLNLEDQLQDYVRNLRLQGTEIKILKPNFRQRIEQAWNYSKDTFSKVWIWVLVGVGLGAGIHGYVPQDFLASFAGKENWYAVPLATVLGVPLYSNAAGVLPLVGALSEKGLALGTALAFMMAVSALSLPEFLILRKVMKLKLLVSFAGITAFGIMLTGYLFNALLG